MPAAGPRGRRTLHLRYVLPTGSKLALDESAASGKRTTVGNVHGTACHGTHASVVGGAQLCATVRFTPALGPGGKRRIMAVVTRNGLPAAITQVAIYTLPNQALPSRPAKLQLTRSGTTVTVRWSASSGAAKYGVVTKPSSGATMSAFESGGCLGVKLSGIPAKASVSADGRPLALRPRSAAPAWLRSGRQVRKGPPRSPGGSDSR